MHKLIQINETVSVGSTGRIAAQIGNVAITQGWNSYIAYGRESKMCDSNLIKVGSIPGILWHVFQTRVLDRHGLSSTCATKNLVKKIDAIKPDIIHLHNIHGYYLNYEVLFQYLAFVNKPIVWTLHDCWSITGHCSFFEGVGCEKWKTGCGNCPYLKDYPRSFFFDRSLKNYKQKRQAFTKPKNITLVPVSNWLGDLVKQSFLKDSPIKVIHNGTDLEAFKPQGNDIRKKYSIDSGKNIVLGVASVWHERKGLIDFIKLASYDKLQVILVGVTDEIKNQLPRNIIAISRTNSQQDLAELYTCADVFVNPTYDDNFPTTNIEALACGTPVITYNTGGSSEAVDSETGIVVEKGDVQGIVEAIKQLSNKDRTALRDACRNRAIRLYNKNDRFQDYINLYKELLHE